MDGKQLYNHIMIQWQSLHKKINIDVELDDDEINILTAHEIEEGTHMLWTVPVTLYQMIKCSSKMEKIVNRYGYHISLFILSFIYSKYHNDDYIEYIQIWWQWRIACDDSAEMMDSEFVYNLEKKFYKIMDHNMERWAIGSGDMYEEYYALKSSEQKREYLYRVLEC